MRFSTGELSIEEGPLSLAAGRLLRLGIAKASRKAHREGEG
jgi:hypothetical protein